MTASKIEWTDRSDWNPIRGCTRVSPGCGGPGPHGGCYAEAIAARFSAPGQPFHGFAERTAKGPRWTGKVALVEDRLILPLRWRKPEPGSNTVFASSTSDVFHESLTDAEIDRLFAVMALAPHWNFQVLSKRSARMRSWFIPDKYRGAARAERVRAEMQSLRPERIGGLPAWPLPNVWLGVSVEDQARADERREDFASTAAAIKFVSYEPAIGPIDWTGWEFVDQIISGGESGPRARPSHPDWHRQTRAFCAANDIAFFFKQWGEWLPCEVDHDDYGRTVCYPDDGSERDFPDLKGTRPIQTIGKQSMWRVGKKRAGRLLDGVTHDGLPILPELVSGSGTAAGGGGVA